MGLSRKGRVAARTRATATAKKVSTRPNIRISLCSEGFLPYRPHAHQNIAISTPPSRRGSSTMKTAQESNTGLLPTKELKK